MPKYLGALTIVLLLGIVLSRVFLLKWQGIKAMKFGNIDKTDFLIPPLALFYFYVLFAAAFDWPNVSTRQFLSAVLPRGPLHSVVEPDFVQAELPDWHRYRSS